MKVNAKTVTSTTITVEYSSGKTENFRSKDHLVKTIKERILKREQNMDRHQKTIENEIHNINTCRQAIAHLNDNLKQALEFKDDTTQTETPQVEAIIENGNAMALGTPIEDDLVEVYDPYGQNTL